MLVFYRAGALAIFLLLFLENVMKRFSFNQGSRAQCKAQEPYL